MGAQLQRFLFEGLPRPPMGCHAIAVDDFVFVGGLLPTDYETGIAPAAMTTSALPLVDDGARSQSEYVVALAGRVLAESGSSFDRVVRVDQFITDRRAAAPYLRARREAFPIPRRPASSLLHIAGLAVPDARVSADLVAVRSGIELHRIFNDAVSVNFPGAPHGARAGPFVFVQGQIATDFSAPIAAKARASPYWYETPVERETEYIVETLATILSGSGSSLESIVKAHVYLTDLTDFAEFERVWARHFGSHPPARTVIPVSSLGSGECRIEITVIATIAGTSREYISSADGQSRLTQSTAVRAGNFVFLSGLIAGDLQRGLAPEATLPKGAPFFGSEVESQTSYILDRAQEICETAGTSLDRLVWAQVFLRDMKDYHAFARTWNDRLRSDQPVVNAIQTPDVGLCPGARVLLDLVAYVPGRTGS